MMKLFFVINLIFYYKYYQKLKTIFNPKFSQIKKHTNK